MGKRSSFTRRKNDLYRTFDPRAVRPLAAHIAPGTLYVEPCAANGSLIELLTSIELICVDAFDVEPGVAWVRYGDALAEAIIAPVIITNPPWSRWLLHALIERLSAQAPTWLLFDADWLHNKTAAPWRRYLVKVVSVGRLKWIEGTKHDAKDNCAWYLFDINHDGSPPIIYPAGSRAIF